MARLTVHGATCGADLRDCKVCGGQCIRKRYLKTLNGCGSWGALLSANANNGANAGFGYLNTNNRATNAWTNNALRLYRYPFGILTSTIYKEIKGTVTIPHGKTIEWKLTV